MFAHGSDLLLLVLAEVLVRRQLCTGSRRSALAPRLIAGSAVKCQCEMKATPNPVVLVEKNK